MTVNLYRTTLPYVRTIGKDSDGAHDPGDLYDGWVACIEGSDTLGCIAEDPYTAIGAALRQALFFGKWETPEDLKIKTFLEEQYRGFLEDDPDGHLRDVGNSLYQSGGNEEIDLQFFFHRVLNRIEFGVEEWMG